MAVDADPRAIETLAETLRHDAALQLAGVAGSLDLAREALRRVCRGDAPVSPSAARHLVARWTAGSVAASADPARPGAERLGRREAEVLAWFARGLTGVEVAARLGVSTHTVATHVKNSYGKLGVSNRVQAVNRARDLGQIPPSAAGLNS